MKGINDLNNNSLQNTKHSSTLKPYVDKLLKTPYPQDFSPLISDNMLSESCYRLVDTIRFPYDLKLNSNTTQTINNELNWVMMFMVKPYNCLMDTEEAISEEEIRECKENDIDIYNGENKLISIEHLLTFSSIKKFNLTELDIKKLIECENKHKITKSGKYIIYYNVEPDRVSMFDDYDKEGEEERFSNITLNDAKLEESWSNEYIDLKNQDPLFFDEKTQFEDVDDEDLTKSSLNDKFQSNFRLFINLNALEKPNNYYYEETKLFSKKMKSIRKHTRKERRKPAEEEPRDQFEDI